MIAMQRSATPGQSLHFDFTRCGWSVLPPCDEGSGADRRVAFKDGDEGMDEWTFDSLGTWQDHSGGCRGKDYRFNSGTAARLGAGLRTPPLYYSRRQELGLAQRVDVLWYRFHNDKHWIPTHTSCNLSQAQFTDYVGRL